MAKSDWEKHQRRITGCKKCPRLIKHCQHMATVKRKSFQADNYWGKPVPDFGAPPADLLIVGLAPAAHGANRTGRMFTGDRSGDWLFKAMHKAGFANQPTSVDQNDGLCLSNAVITAACHCAPPDNKPSREEVENCEPHLDSTIALCEPKVFLALGKLGWDATVRYALKKEWLATHQETETKTSNGIVMKRKRVARPKFSHGAEVQFLNGRWLVGSYHPSQQNTFTGRLTEKMFNAVFKQVNKKIVSMR